MLKLVPGKLYIVQDTEGHQDGVYLTTHRWHARNILIPSGAIVMYVGNNPAALAEGDVFICPDGRLRGWDMGAYAGWERFLRPV